MAGARFIIDTNTLIEAYRREYGFDICPGYWDLMGKAFSAGIVVSHDKVRKEMLRSGDALSQWVGKLDKAYFPKEDDAEFVVWQQLCYWARSRGYTEAAVAQFSDMDYADPWVCAKAKALGLTLVTQEVSAPLARRNVKLPDACASIGVPYCDMFTMLRELKASFVLTDGHRF